MNRVLDVEFILFGTVDFEQLGFWFLYLTSLESGHLGFENCVQLVDEDYEEAVGNKKWFGGKWKRKRNEKMKKKYLFLGQNKLNYSPKCVKISS